MRKFATLILLMLFTLSAVPQEQPAAYIAYKQKYPEGQPLNHQDSIGLMSLPQKTLPAYLRSDPLPPMVDNSMLMYLRPVFAQEGSSCGQAAMIGYNFTYEMACLRNQPAQYPQTQYPSHFAWNFQNGGNGWYGVSYFHSIEVLRKCGTMNVADYGGMGDDGRRWINGYNVYYNGMYNRVRGVYSINTGTEEGILTLKHWLLDHMGEGTHGGVASYYANTPWNANFLNDTTPEGGKFVMTAWYPIASHAMTIVGYNDSIRWDYNGDGQYTNNIDINDDGVIDPRDWEIGGVKFVNSHGIGAQDSGFCYMMYKCLAETFENGGIWNQSVHILDIDPNYQPLVTYKIKLKHNNRQMVKILAGVSQDTADTAPAWFMDFPIIDYQGANHYLQGQDTAENLKYLQFGLDITPLLSHLHPNQPAKFFFLVDENDPYGEGDGEITQFSVMDYTSAQPQEYISSQVPAGINNNSRTSASVVYTPDFDIVTITTDSLPPFSAGEPYSYQMQASNGTAPYTWEPVYNYRIEQSEDSMPMVDAIHVLTTAATDTIMPVPLGFSFPFYGKWYDTVYMHIDGHLQFDNTQNPWPYLEEPVLLFRSNRMITPISNAGFTIIPADGDGGWAEINDSAATFRWKLSYSASPGKTDMNFAVRLGPDGKIDFFYGNSTLGGISWLGGISAGNKTDFIDVPFSGVPTVAPGTKITFYYRPEPGQLQLSDNGLLTGQFGEDNFIYDFSCRVTDKSGLTDTKTYQLTSGPYLYFTIHANGDGKLDYGDSVSVDVEVVNGTAEPLTNSTLQLATSDPYIEMLVANCSPGTIQPGESIFIPDALQFNVSINVPDQRDLLFDAMLSTDDKSWQKEPVYKANAPDLQLKEYYVDTYDQVLDPGETAQFKVTLHNGGNAVIDSVNGTLTSLDPEVQVLNNPVQDYGTIGKSVSVTHYFTLHADETTPDGFTARFILSTTSLQGLQREDSIMIRIGKIPVLVIDMDPNNHSGPGIKAMLDNLDVISDYDYNITKDIKYYHSLFICLGYYNTNHELTLWEGQQLADYLDNGGKIYMEGRTAWRDDPGTPVKTKFNINFNNTATVFDTLTGIDSTFTQGLEFINEATIPFSYYYLVPIEPAYDILQDNDNFRSCAVAYDAGVYKTIGTLFEYGTLADLSPNATRDLMIRYLEFFDIPVEPVGVTDVLSDKGMKLTLYPNPAGGKLTVVSWQSAVSSQRSAVRLGIFDVYGRKILSLDKVSSFPYTIDISILPEGMYILRLTGDDGSSASAKFLKASH